jgi:pyridoxal/pyridoxine/pyridoxamine kinase
MGDNGKLYIPEDEVPEYKALLREADLILPNQFEAECVVTPCCSIRQLLMLKWQIARRHAYH